MHFLKRQRAPTRRSFCLKRQCELRSEYLIDKFTLGERLDSAHLQIHLVHHTNTAPGLFQHHGFGTGAAEPKVFHTVGLHSLSITWSADGVKNEDPAFPQVVEWLRALRIRAAL
jgi:hypothetical protein